MKRTWPRLRLVLAALAPGLISPTSADNSPVTTVPVYVPGYRSENWENLAGSVIASDSTATTYTIFCPNTDDCHISGPLQFTFAEGPSTFKYSGEIESRLTASISCQLASTTAATCTEYSSFGPGFTRGNTTGPTDELRTTTYSGTDVDWGVLTLTSPAPDATATDAQDTGVSTVASTDTAWYFPSATRTGSSTSGAGRGRGRGLEHGRAVVVGGAVVVLVVVGGLGGV